MLVTSCCYRQPFKFTPTGCREKPINLMSLFLDCGRRLEDLQTNIHASATQKGTCPRNLLALRQPSFFFQSQFSLMKLTQCKSQSNQATVGCPRKATSQRPGGSAVNVLVPETTARLQRTQGILPLYMSCFTVYLHTKDLTYL